MRREIRGLAWDDLVYCKDVNTIWNKLKSDLLIIRDKFIGKTRKQKARCKWVTKDVQKLRKAKKKAWDKYQKSNKNNSLYDEYKEKLRQSVKENKRAKLEFEKKLADNIKTDCKSFYSYISSKSRSKNKV